MAALSAEIKHAARRRLPSWPHTKLPLTPTKTQLHLARIPFFAVKPLAGAGFQVEKLVEVKEIFSYTRSSRVRK
jgi:hypothetical protein